MSIQSEPIAHENDRYTEVETRCGSQMVDTSNLLNFPNGLPGFDDLHRFALFHQEGNTSVFYLQSMDDPDIRLPVISPHWFQVDYQIALSDEEAALLEIEKPEDLEVLVTIADNDNGEAQPHTNFNDPILVNTGKRLALQKTLHNVNGSLVIHSH